MSKWDRWGQLALLISIFAVVLYSSVRQELRMTGDFQTHPTHVTTWCDERGHWHDVPTTRREGQPREEWMREAKQDLDASIKEFGPPMDPQPERRDGR